MEGFLGLLVYYRSKRRIQGIWNFFGDCWFTIDLNEGFKAHGSFLGLLVYYRSKRRIQGAWKVF